MKRFLAILLILCMALFAVACNNEESKPTDASEKPTAAPTEKPTETPTEKPTETPTEGNQGEVDYAAKSEGVMTYAQYDAAAVDAEVVIEAYVQATQSWWEDKITVYLQDPDGAYFAYELACSETDAAKLTKGTKIKITGYKAVWAGEIEIMDGTFEFCDDGLTWVAEATDVTDLLGTDELIKHQNKYVKFTDMTVAKITYKNDQPGDDIYVDFTKGEATYSFCVERYLTSPDTDFYKSFADLTVGTVVDVEGFLYWYEGVNTHMTAIVTK